MEGTSVQNQSSMSVVIQARVRMARALFLLLFFFSSSLPVASAKNITSSLLSISRWRNCSAALLKPITSCHTGGGGEEALERRQTHD